jgi:hypothetical protein
MFKVLKTGKRQKKSWKRMITKVTFVGPGFTRKPPKYERFIRPTGLRMTKAHVTHPELKATFCLKVRSGALLARRMHAGAAELCHGQPTSSCPGGMLCSAGCDSHLQGAPRAAHPSCRSQDLWAHHVTPC